MFDCVWNRAGERTIEQFTTVGLTAGDFESHNVALGEVSLIRDSIRRE